MAGHRRHGGTSKALRQDEIAVEGSKARKRAQVSGSCPQPGACHDTRALFEQRVSQRLRARSNDMVTWTSASSTEVA